METWSTVRRNINIGTYSGFFLKKKHYSVDLNNESTALVVRILLLLFKKWMCSHFALKNNRNLRTEESFSAHCRQKAGVSILNGGKQRTSGEEAFSKGPASYLLLYSNIIWNCGGTRKNKWWQRGQSGIAPCDGYALLSSFLSVKSGLCFLNTEYLSTCTHNTHKYVPFPIRSLLLCQFYSSPRHQNPFSKVEGQRIDSHLGAYCSCNFLSPEPDGILEA